MEFFRIQRDIPFMRHALVFNAISLITFLAAVFFLATRGLHFSIEFTGGTVIEVAYAQSADIAKARSAVEGLGLGEVQVQNFGSSRDVLIRVPVREGAKEADTVSRVFTALCRSEGGQVRRSDLNARQADHQRIARKDFRERLGNHCTNAPAEETLWRVFAR